MKMVLLGTTGYHPSHARHTASFFMPEQGLMFDAGTGIFRAHELVATKELDIFLSHAHLDHVFGLTFLFDVLSGKKLDRLTVHARPQDIAAIDTHLFAEPLFPVKLTKLNCEWRPYGASAIPVGGGGKLTHFPLEHPGGSVGFRVEWPGRSMAYVTDTIAEPTAEYVEKIRGVDLLVHECSFNDSQEEWARFTGHSFTTGVAQVAKAAGVKRLLLVHVSPMNSQDDPIGLDVARKIFPQTEIATDLMTVEL
jgi:ribonuclease Z